MVGIGFAMLGLGVWSLDARRRGGLAEARLLQRAAIVLGPSGFVAVICGWIVTEVGRQPYTVYGLLRTADSISPIAARARDIRSSCLSSSISRASGTSDI